MDLGLPEADYRTAYISISAEINVTTTEQIIAVATNLVTQPQGNPAQPHPPFNRLYFMLSTPGGQVMNGINIYNVLRGLPAKIVFHNVGNVDSIGNAIFLAGDERYACPHSTFMFHGVGFDVNTGARIEQKNAQEMLDGILADQKRISSVLVERTTLNEVQALDLFKEARTKDATYAASVGIVSDIRDIHIPAGAPIFSLVFQR
jgi:ATP-dependent protease ClpP protease subunit